MHELLFQASNAGHQSQDPAVFFSAYRTARHLCCPDDSRRLFQQSRSLTLDLFNIHLVVHRNPKRLKSKFRGDLRDSRRGRMRHVAKRGTIDISIHSAATKKLRMVERIECFETQL